MLSATFQSPYMHIWRKYRPAILQMMIDTNEIPQHYDLSKHEFTRVTAKNKNALAFLLYVRRSKSLNNIRSSEPAQSLLSTLQQSKTAVELMADATFDFFLDDHFVPHIRKAGVDEVGDHLSGAGAGTMNGNDIAMR